MKQKNNLNKILLVLCAFMITLFPNVLDAAGEDYSAGFRIYKYGSKYESKASEVDLSKYDLTKPARRTAYLKAVREAGPNAWFEDYKNGTVEEITSTTSLTPGDTFVVGTTLKFIGSGDPIASLFSLYYSFDPSLVEVLTVTPVSNVDTVTFEPQKVSYIFDEREQYPEDESQGTGVWPIGTWNKDVFNIDADDMISITIRDFELGGETCYDYVEDAPFAFVVFKVKDTATSGAAINLDYIFKNGTETLGSNPLGTIDVPIQMNNSHILSVAEAAASDDTTLSALSVKNGTTEYILTPTFTSGSTTDTYSTIVPSSVTNVDIQATMTTPGSILPGGLGNKSLNVGDNTFTFTATAANGDIKVYTIKVKKLDNDTKLDTLTLSDITFTFNSTTDTYNLTTPYKTTSTTVNATLPAGSKATIDSGTGAWPLTTVGGVNTRKVVVKAEDCGYTTTQVPGVTCTTGEYTLNVTRSNPSSDATLSTLNVDGALVTGFNSNTETYTLSPVGKNKTSINITATATDTNATVSGTGSKTLTAGTDHSFDVVVTAEDGTTTKTYTINIRKKSDNTTLSALTVSNSGTNYILTPTFVSGSTTNTYSTVVPSSVSSVDIQATMTTPGSILSTELGTKTVNVGDNTFTFTTTAEDGETTKTYTINVKRLDNDTKLDTLTLSGITFTFNPTTDTYNLTTPYKTTSTTVNATLPTGSKATIDSGTGSWPLTTVGGVNTRKVVVKAEDCGYTTTQVPGVTCTTGEYTLNVTRSNPSNDATLSALNVDGSLVTGFNSNTETYTLSPVKNNKNSINITATTTDSNATIVGVGNRNLTVGDNAIDIIVTAEDGTTQKTYTVNIRRQSNVTTLDSLNVTSDPQGVMNTIIENEKYIYIYDEAVTTVEVTATATSPAKVTGGTGTINVSDGSTIIVVTAEDGTIKNYTLQFSRKTSSDVRLSSIKVSNGTNEYTVTPEVADDVDTYNVTIPNDISSVEVLAKTKSGSANVISGNGPVNNIGFDTISKTITVQAEDTNRKDYTLNITRQKSDNANLTDIKIDGISITGFDKDTIDYTLSDVNGDVNSLNITFTKENQYSNVNITGNTLVDGNNQIKLTVTPQDGSASKVYTLNVKRKSKIADLSTLTVTSNPGGTLSPSFNANNINYTYKYQDGVTQIDVNATAAGNATIISGVKSYDPLTESSASIEVEAEDGTKKTYTINFSRELSTDNRLGSITVTNGSDTYNVTPTVADGVTAYNVTIPHDVTSVNIAATAKSNFATVTSGTGLVDNIGFTPINRNIVIKPESGANATYTLTITRQESNDAYLTGISVDGTPITGFDKDTLEYTLGDVDSTVTSLNLTYTKSNQYANATIVAGTNNLVAGSDNTVIIRVTSQDRSETKEYKLKVRRKDNDTTLSGLTITSSPQGSYTPTFNPSTKEYTYKYDRSVTTVNVNATATSGTVISGNGGYSIPETKEVTIEVAAEDENITDTYKVKFEQILDNDSTLKTLNVSHNGTTFTLTPSFSPSRKNYNLTVEGDVDSVLIEAEANSEYSKGISGDTGTITLVSGSNTKTITVTAEDDTTTTYTLNITRKINTNATVTDIKVDGETIDGFDPTTATYDLGSVPYDTDSMLISATPTAGATLSGDTGNQSLDVGDNILEIDVTAQDGTTTGKYTIKVRRQSNDYSLSNITVTSSPASTVDKDINGDFTINVPSGVNTITINPTTTHGSARVTNLSDLSNLDVTSITYVDISVEAEDSLYSGTHRVKINKLKSTNVYLSSLTVDQGTLSPIFNKETISYTVNVGTEVSSITITGVAEDSKSTVSGDGTKPLNPGANTFTITVTAEDDSTKDYTVVVNREQKSILTLSDLTIDGVTIDDFSPNKTDYTITVPYSKNSVDIEATTSDTDANITGSGIGSHTLSQNSEVFSFTVTAQDGSTQVYNITINKEAPDTDNTLSDLVIDGYTLSPEFSPNEENYTIGKVSDTIDTLTVNVTPGSDKSTVKYKVNGTEVTPTDNKLSIPSNLGPGTIEVVVTAEDGSEKTYTVRYEKSDGSDEGLDKIISAKKADGITDIHTIDNDFVLTVRLSTQLSDFKNEFENPNSELYLYDLDGTEVSTGIVKTGMTIKLIRNGNELDSKLLVIYGDTNNDGIINMQDAGLILDYYLDSTTATLSNVPASLKAADASQDDIVNMQDAGLILDYYLDADSSPLGK